MMDEGYHFTTILPKLPENKSQPRNRCVYCWEKKLKRTYVENICWNFNVNPCVGDCYRDYHIENGIK